MAGRMGWGWLAALGVAGVAAGLLAGVAPAEDMAAAGMLVAFAGGIRQASGLPNPCAPPGKGAGRG